MIVNSKLPDVGTSIFSVMSRMAADHEAINLSQGFPDFPVHPELIDRAHHYMQKGLNQYAPGNGVPRLKKAISEMTNRLYGVTPDPEDEITITTGATEGLFATITALVERGDEVILFDPAYDSYDPAIRLCGGVPVHLNLEYPSFGIPWADLADAINVKTKAIIINNPHNPTGSILKKEDLIELGRIAAEKDLIVISDEVYHNMVFDDIRHTSALQIEDLKDRSVAVFSFGKTFHATGWKSGYTIASEAITQEIRRVRQFVTFTVNTPIQFALADFIEDPAHYENLAGFFEEKRDVFVNAVKASRFKAITSSGTYFQLLEYSEINDLGDRDMCEQMTKENGLASIPVSVFNHDGHDNQLLRFCFAKDDSTLLAAAKILNEL
ncbi:MAG: methionine aminotransferase [Cytophagales bacterium]|nr:methionine aminotransferase [Cytophagales bacterium]